MNWNCTGSSVLFCNTIIRLTVVLMGMLPKFTELVLKDTSGPSINYHKQLESLVTKSTAVTPQNCCFWTISECYFKAICGSCASSSSRIHDLYVNGTKRYAITLTLQELHALITISVGENMNCGSTSFSTRVILTPHSTFVIVTNQT